jgi:hypothetical protein
MRLGDPCPVRPNRYFAYDRTNIREEKNKMTFLNVSAQLAPLTRALRVSLQVGDGERTDDVARPTKLLRDAFTSHTNTAGVTGAATSNKQTQECHSAIHLCRTIQISHAMSDSQIHKTAKPSRCAVASG